MGGTVALLRPQSRMTWARLLHAAVRLRTGQLSSLHFRYFVGPDPKAREGIRAERSGDRDIRRVASPRQQNPADPGDVVPCIERMPMSAEIDLEPRREIAGRKGWRGTDVAQISGAVAGRNVQGPAERDRQMCIVAADSQTFLIGFRRRPCHPCVLVTEIYPLIYEIADCLDARPTRGRIFE